MLDGHCLLDKAETSRAERQVSGAFVVVVCAAVDEPVTRAVEARSAGQEAILQLLKHSL